jgi:hypothetical protein
MHMVSHTQHYSQRNTNAWPSTTPHHSHPLQARLGRCAAPYIRVQDWSRRTVTQHCASQCGGCAGRPTPRLADSMAPPDQYCCAFAAGAYYAGPNGTAAVA